jgi:DNA-binding XRE family transcriptional regulator
MRQYPKIPRILKINRIDGLQASVVFNNGESRLIDFNVVFKEIKLNRHSPAYKLMNPRSFKKAKLNNQTLSWNNVEQYINFKNKRIKVPFEIGADVLYQMSLPDRAIMDLPIGSILKTARQNVGLTQEAVAEKSGTSRNYISRIENNASGIELSTLKKIVNMGLGKQLEIKIK